MTTTTYGRPLQGAGSVKALEADFDSPGRERSVETVRDELARTAEELESLVSEMARRLAPVLREEPDAPEKAEPGLPLPCELAQALARSERAFSAQADRISTMLRNLEV